jgi:hypothetical protein
MFLFALLEYWESSRSDQETIPFSELAFGWGSPGLVFKLDELSLMTRLERLNDLTNGELSYADTAGLRQVYRRVKRTPLKALAEHYHGISRTGVAA